MKPESRFIKNVHDVLHPDVYREKMFNPLRGGTPDCVYYGYKRSPDLWIEYKWVKRFSKTIKPDLSSLQLAWLMRAWDRGREPWVVVGSPTGCVQLVAPPEWKHGVDRESHPVLAKPELIRRIENRCGLEFLAAQQRAASTSTASSSSRC